MIPYPSTTPRGTELWRIVNQIVLYFSYAKRSTQTGKYIHKKTWKKPTPNRKTERMKKSLTSVKPTSHIMLNRMQTRIIFLTQKWWNIGGEVKEPAKSPQYTAEPNSPRDALSRPRSFFIVTVHAGIHPWSTLTRILVIQITTNQKTWDGLIVDLSTAWVILECSSSTLSRSSILSMILPSFFFCERPFDRRELSSSSSLRSETMRSA